MRTAARRVAAASSAVMVPLCSTWRWRAASRVSCRQWHPTPVQCLPAQRRDKIPALSVPSSPPLMLDPPFTPVDGESTAATTELPAPPATTTDQKDTRSSAPPTVYGCRRCRTPLFTSDDLLPGSRVGHHPTGWPTFTDTIHSRTLPRRAVLQRRAVRTTDAAPPPFTTNTPTATSATVTADATRAHKMNAAAELRASLASVTTATTSLTPRGLAVEADVYRIAGRGVERHTARTWREKTLRDENHRADPALLEGCCPTCGGAVCRLVTRSRGAVTYVSTANALTVLATSAHIQ